MITGLRRRVWCAAAALVMCILASHGAPASAQAAIGCGPLTNAYGPFDYRDPVARRDNLPIVVRFHLTPDVQMLVRGNTSTILGDLNYTLRAFPNEPFALQSLAQYALEGRKFIEYDSIPSFDCYFQRAIEFVPDDPAVRVIYGNFLFKSGEMAEARKQYEVALKLAPASPEICYDVGLFFVDTGDLQRAKRLARIAYAGGYPLPGLREKIAAAESAAGARPRRKSK